MKRTVPVLGLAGYSGSGKTTFLEKLIAELKHRGRRVGVIKHTHHLVDFDQPGKDTWRHAKAGADVVALATPGGVFLVRKFEGDPGPEEVISMVRGVDLVIIEGYKTGSWPKIAVFRREAPVRPDIPAEELLAVVSDMEQDMDVPHFSLEDASGVADLIEQAFLK